MKEFEVAACNLPAELSFNLMENHNMSFNQENAPGIYRVIFFSFADILKHYKSKNLPKIGFILKDHGGNFKFGAILNYHAPEEGDDTSDDKGNYTLEFTIDANDMNDMDMTVDNHSDIFIECMSRMMSSIMTARFTTTRYCNDVFIEAIDTLIKFLDANASESDETILVYKGVFTASVTVDGDMKTISIVPGEMIKQYIKGDSSL